jgi:hypothetical protein
VKALREGPWWLKVLAAIGALYLVATAISLIVFLLVVLWAE